MYDVIMGFLARYIGEKIVFIVPVGVLIFLIHFYGSEKWKDFHNFEKTVFPLLIGLLTFYLLIEPVSSYLLFVWNIFSFTNESYIFTAPSTQQRSSFFILSLAIVGFIGWLRITNDNKPLYEINKTFELTIKGLFVLWVGVILSLLFFAISLHYADYKICSSHLFKTLLTRNIIPLFLFIFIFFALYGKLYEYIKKISSGQIKHNKKLRNYIIMAVLVIIIVSPVSGLFFFKPTIQDHGETIHSITNDPGLTIGYKIGYGAFSIPEELICRENITKEYTINTKMLSWVRVDGPDFIVTDAKKWINKSTSKNYATNENKTYFIVNESRYQKVNVTVNGFRVIELIRDNDYDFEIEGRKLGNQTEIDFTIINMMPHTLNLGKINLHTHRPYNLTDWGPKNDGIYDVVDKTPKNKLIFVDLKGNQSSNVTLFLEEIEMNTTG